jgi:hypothetical protein
VIVAQWVRSERRINVVPRPAAGCEGIPGLAGVMGQCRESLASQLLMGCVMISKLESQRFPEERNSTPGQSLTVNFRLNGFEYQTLNRHKQTLFLNLSGAIDV